MIAVKIINSSPAAGSRRIIIQFREFMMVRSTNQHPPQKQGLEHKLPALHKKSTSKQNYHQNTNSTRISIPISLGPARALPPGTHKTERSIIKTSKPRGSSSSLHRQRRYQSPAAPYLSVGSGGNSKKHNLRREQDQVSGQKRQASTIESTEEAAGKRRVMTESNRDQLEIRDIIGKKLSKEGSNTKIRHIHELVKLQKLKKKPHKYYHYQATQDYRKKPKLLLPCALKDQNNYHEWRRVRMGLNQESPRYSESTFELETERLQSYIRKNQTNLRDYLHFQQELLKMRPWKLKISLQ